MLIERPSGEIRIVGPYLTSRLHTCSSSSPLTVFGPDGRICMIQPAGIVYKRKKT